MSAFRHLYTHVPFCARRCTYCDFSIAVRRTLPVGDYLGALAAELGLATSNGLDWVGAETVYLGGGTPSLLDASAATVLVTTLLAGEEKREVTLEANPDDVTPERAAAWRRAGVNRLSIGAQSFDPLVLAWMHRTHDPAAIAAAVSVARQAGIANLSLDLIFALPAELGRDFAADLEQLIALEPDHVSLYGLTVEAGSPLARQFARGEGRPAPDTSHEDEYLAAHERLAAAGYLFYEVSNAARPGREAVHNAAYWRLVPYLGFGPSAHSFDGTRRWWNEPAYSKWSRALAAGQDPLAGSEILDEAARRLELLYLGLRTISGVDVSEHPAELRDRAPAWVREGWAEWRAGTAGGHARLALTPQGWLRLDSLVAAI